MPFSEALWFPRHLPVLFGDLAPRAGLETGLKMGLSELSETRLEHSVGFCPASSAGKNRRSWSFGGKGIVGRIWSSVRVRRSLIE
jgi:hypothetical protein